MQRFLNWMYFGNDALPLGYSYVAKMMKQGLTNIGVVLGYPAKTLIFHSLPWKEFSWANNQTAGLFTMWESSQCPGGFRAGMEIFDFVVTPCRYSRDLFSTFYDKPIYVVPHGVDSTVFYPDRQPSDTFTVISAATNPRKGFEDLVEGFKRAAIPNSKLILKGPHFRIDPIVKTLPANVKVLDRVLSGDKLRTLYNSADLYFSASRGEGWDLIAFEALACGTPTVVPDHTAYKDWGHLAQGKLYKLIPKESPIKEVFGASGDWLHCDPDEIAQALWLGYDNQEAWKARALESAATIRSNYSWDDSARTLVDQLGDLPELERTGPQFSRKPMVMCKCTKSLPFFDNGGMRGGPLKEGAQYLFPSGIARDLEKAGYVIQGEAYARREGK